jgi:hypothetical protein
MSRWRFTFLHTLCREFFIFIQDILIAITPLVITIRMDSALVRQTDMIILLGLCLSTRFVWETSWLVLVNLDMLPELSTTLCTIGGLSMLGFLEVRRARYCFLVIEGLVMFLDTKVVKKLGASSRVSRLSRDCMLNASTTWHPVIKSQIELGFSQGWLVARQPIHKII